MKIFIIHKIIYFAVFTLIAMPSLGQVSISNGSPTNTPNGLVDMQNSTAGIVYPRFELTDITVEAPVLNPDGGSLVPGTVVFNTNTTTRGDNTDVYPGIYAWNGTRWTTQYLKEDSFIAEQTPLEQRITNSGGYVDVNGLGNGSSFTPKYTGTYRVKANFNFGAGEVINYAGHVVSMATQEGFFRITLGSDSYEIYTHAYSVYNNEVNSGTLYEKFRHDSSLIMYVDLTEGVPFAYRFEVDMFVSNNFVDNGDSGTGRSYVGVGLPCTIEFTYLEK